MEERREDSRADVELEVHYRTTQEFLVAYSQNISGGGVYNRTQQPLPLNREVQLRFTLPGFPGVIVARGLVVWCSPASTRSSFPPGMGIKFLNIDPEIKEQIIELVNKTKAANAKPDQKA